MLSAAVAVFLFWNMAEAGGAKGEPKPLAPALRIARPKSKSALSVKRTSMDDEAETPDSPGPAVVRSARPGKTGKPASRKSPPLPGQGSDVSGAKPIVEDASADSKPAAAARVKAPVTATTDDSPPAATEESVDDERSSIDDEPECDSADAPGELPADSTDADAATSIQDSNPPAAGSTNLPKELVPDAVAPPGKKRVPPAAVRPAAPAKSGDDFTPAKRQTKAAPPNGTADLPELTPAMIRIRDRLRKVLAHYYDRPVNARDHTPWEAFHWIIAYNVYAEIQADGPWGQRTNAVGWLCYNRPCHGQTLLSIEQGRLKAMYGVGLQGHEGQFLAILAQSRVMIDYPIRVQKREFTVADLVRSEMLSCQTGTELTFKLIALSHYLELNSNWKNREGETWDIPRLIREEISKPIQGAACGGTHRLMGLSYAVRMRQMRGEPIDGEYRRAQAYVRDYHRYALSLQNPDGSFSTNWLAGREARSDIDRRVQTTGHILEWLVFSLTDEELRQPKIVKTVDYLTGILLKEPDRTWKIGPLGHALRALTLYDRRLFEPHDQPDEEEGGLVETDLEDLGSPAKTSSATPPPVHSAARPRIVPDKTQPSVKTSAPPQEPPTSESPDDTESASESSAPPDASHEDLEDILMNEAEPSTPPDDEGDESPGGDANTEEPAATSETEAESEEEPTGVEDDTESGVEEAAESVEESTDPDEDEPAPVQRAVKPQRK